MPTSVPSPAPPQQGASARSQGRGRGADAPTPLRWDLDLLRIVAILGVVAIHVFPLILTDKSLVGTPTGDFAVTVQTVSIRCVPLFIMISGALLLAPRMHARGPWQFYRRRAGRLLPALVFWHLFYLVGIRMWLNGRDLTPERILVDLIDARIYTALYFLWLILGLYLVAPVLAAFLADGGRRRAVATAVVGVVWASAVWATPMVSGLLGAPRPVQAGMLTWWFHYVGIFVAGWAWREPRATGRRWLWAWLLALVLVAFQVWQQLNPGEHPWLVALLPPGYISLVTSLSAVAVFVGVIDLCARVSLPARGVQLIRTVGQATFGVFLFHLAVIAGLRVWAPDFYGDPRPVAKTAMFAVVVAVSLAVSVVAARVPVLRRLF